MLDETESAYDLAASGYLMADDARALVKRSLQELSSLRETFAPMLGYASEDIARLKGLETKLKNFQPKRGRPLLGRIRRSEINTYQRVFHALAEQSPTAGVAKQIIESVLARA